MDLHDLLAGGTTDVKVEWEGEVVQVTFLKHAYTPKLEAEVMSESGKGGGQAVAELLEKLIDSWDITTGGDAYPPTRENLSRLPVSFLIAVMKAVTEAMTADPLLSVVSDGQS